MNQEIKKTPEQVRHEKQVEEYMLYVTQEQDNIGLLGYQPRLRHIRKVYKKGELSQLELKLVLAALANELQGEDEPFKSIRDFANWAFPGLHKRVEAKKRQKAAVSTLSVVEQAAAVKQILGDSSPKRTKTKQATPRPIEINKANLPACLRHLV